MSILINNLDSLFYRCNKINRNFINWERLGCGYNDPNYVSLSLSDNSERRFKGSEFLNLIFFYEEDVSIADQSIFAKSLNNRIVAPIE